MDYLTTVICELIYQGLLFVSWGEYITHLFYQILAGWRTLHKLSTLSTMLDTFRASQHNNHGPDCSLTMFLKLSFKSLNILHSLIKNNRRKKHPGSLKWGAAPSRGRLEPGLHILNCVRCCGAKSEWIQWIAWTFMDFNTSVTMSGSDEIFMSNLCLCGQRLERTTARAACFSSHRFWVLTVAALFGQEI